MPQEADTPLHRMRDDLIERLRAYESGVLKTQTQTTGGLVDTTAETMARLRANIAELERVISGQPRH